MASKLPQITLYYIISHYILREFACRTAIILAQPRVSRLRAAVVYVLSRGCAGRIPDPGLPNAGFARAPPKSLLRIVVSCEKRVLSVAEIWRLKSVPLIYRNKNPLHAGVHRATGFGTQNWPQIHQNFNIF